MQKYRNPNDDKIVGIVREFFLYKDSIKRGRAGKYNVNMSVIETLTRKSQLVRIMLIRMVDNNIFEKDVLDDLVLN